jgi:dUTPase|tara:strand:+ start:310 stop:810 length:501 start_codon:yes stop_codon:yes gene_type:complete
MNTVKFSLTESALKILTSVGVNPREYVSAYDGESSGLDLYNVGPKVKVHGRTKWSVYGEEPVVVPVGIKLLLPMGTVGLIRERGSIFGTGLSYRGGVIDPGFSGEVFVNLVNLGERDTQIPPGAKLPLQLIVVPCIHNFELISDLEYMENSRGFVRGERSLGSTNS